MVRSRGALVAYHPIEPDRIDVVAHGVRALPPGGPTPDLGRTVLTVSTFEPHKNLARLLDDLALCAALGGRGRERALPFTWERAVRDTRNTYERAVTS